MKTLAAILLLAGSALGQVKPEQTQTPPAAPARPSDNQASRSIAADQGNAQKAKAVLDQMIQALGGQGYLNLQDVSQQGRTYSFYHGQPNSVGTLFWRFYKFPDKERVELTKQRDVAYVLNGDKGYEITYKGTAMEDPKTLTESLRRRAHSLEWVVRKWLNEPGIALFDEGLAVAGDKPAEQVSILNANNDSVTLYIDTNTHLPIKKTYSWRDPTDKLRNTEEEVYDGYRQVQGVMTPFSITRYLNGEMSNQRFLHSVIYNTGLSDSMFAGSVTYDPNKLPAKR